MTKRSTKQAYETPITEALELRFEGVLCGSPEGFTQGGAGFFGVEDTYQNGDF